jgi:hypothetical protein
MLKSRLLGAVGIVVIVGCVLTAQTPVRPVVMVLSATMVAAQTPDASGVLAGCITDLSGQRLPNVKVDVSSGSIHREVLSNPTTGCYELTDLSKGSYVVFARLTGFASVTRDQIAVEPGRSERVDLQMRIPARCECITPVGGRTLAYLWSIAGAVVRLRITGHEPTPVLPRGVSYYVTHTADVLDVWKRDVTGGPFGATMRFNQRPLEETEPYAVGQEFVIFLFWDRNTNALTRIGDDDDQIAAFAIHDGAINYALGLDYLLLNLQTLSRATPTR